MCSYDMFYDSWGIVMWVFTLEFFGSNYVWLLCNTERPGSSYVNSLQPGLKLKT